MIKWVDSSFIESKSKAIDQEVMKKEVITYSYKAYRSSRQILISAAKLPSALAEVGSLVAVLS